MLGRAEETYEEGLVRLGEVEVTILDDHRFNLRQVGGGGHTHDGGGESHSREETHLAIRCCL